MKNQWLQRLWSGCWRRGLAWLACVGLALASSAGAAEVTVYAAASLGHAFRDMAQAFEAQHPDVNIVYSFAASDILQRQIVNGAPAHLFASADQVAMDKAEQAGVVQPNTRQNFARNALVLITPADQQSIHSVADLENPAYSRIALGNPDTVPAGRYARAGLQHVGIWDTLMSRQVLGQNVRQVLDYVARGEVDAGFVFATDAASLSDRVRVVEKIKSPVAVLYPLVLVQRHDPPEQARQFYDFILSEDGQQILHDYGFEQP